MHVQKFISGKEQGLNLILSLACFEFNVKSFNYLRGRYSLVFKGFNIHNQFS